MPTIDWNVKNAINRDVERQHLNKILADIRAAVQSLESKTGSTTITPSTAASIKDIVGQMVINNTESGISVTYNNLAKVLDFAVANFMLTLAGDVTGSVTLSPGSNAVMQVAIDPALIGIGEAPMDNQPYWRQSGGWEMVPPNISTLTEIATSGVMVLDTTDPEEPVWSPRTLQGPDSVKITNADGTAGDPTFRLDGDVNSPGNLFGYGTNMAGVKSWYRPALFESTGILMGGTLSINAGDNTKYDVSATIVGHTDYSINAASPTRTVLSVGPFVAQTVPSLAVIATYVGIQMPGGTLVTQSSPFTAAQTRTIAPLGAVISNGVNLIAVNNLPMVIRAGINQVGDLMAAIGPMNISGNLVSPNGVNLQINKSAGTVFKQGSNFAIDPFNPHGLSLASLTGANFNYRLSNGTQFATTNLIDPNNYEAPLGTLAVIPAANRFTIQRLTVFTSNLVRVQYGQVVYNTMAEAEASLATEAFVTEANIAENGILLCFLIVQDGATDLSDPAQAKFIPASKFGGPVGSGGTSITNTDALPEGLVNLYHTDERVRDVMGATLVAGANVTITVNDPGDIITIASTGGGGGGPTDTDGLPEGVVNLYFTDARARTAVIASSVTNGDTTHSPSGDAVFDYLAANFQPLDADLTAVSALASIGFAVRTAANTWTTRTFQNGTGFTWTNPAGVAGDPTLVLNSNLQAWSAITTASKEDAITAGTDAQFWRGDKTFTNWLNGDFRVGTSSGLFGSGREVVISAGVVGDNISHLSMQGSRTTAGATFGALQFYHQANRVASLVGFRDGADDAGGFIISTKATGVAIANAVRINGVGNVRPGSDNTQDLGDASVRWMHFHTFGISQYGGRFETGVVSPAQLTANTDNWSVTGLSTAAVIRASTNASRNLTGIASPTAGQRVTLCNVGSFDLVLMHDVTSTAANRFYCPNNTDLTLDPNASVDLWYDNTSSRWRVIEPITGGSSSAAVSYLWTENFLKGVLNSPNTGSSYVVNEWRPVSYNVGTAAQSNLTAPGVSMTTGSTSSGLVNLCFTRGTCLAVGWEAQRFGIKFNLPTLSNGTDTYTFQLGLRTVITGAETDRIIATYTHGTNSGNFTLGTMNGGVSTTVNGTAGPAAGVAHTLEIAVNAAGTEVILYLDDVAITTAITTNIPTAGLAMFALLLKTVGTAPRTATIYRGYQKVV